MRLPLRVLIVDPSISDGKAIYEALVGLPQVEIVGLAASHAAVLQKLQRLRPSLLVVNLRMTALDSLVLLRQLHRAGMAVGAIVLSDTTIEGVKNSRRALALGAFDHVSVPVDVPLQENIPWLRERLRRKFQAFLAAGESSHRPAKRRSRPAVVALGISTGGPQSLARVLPRLPADLPVPVLVVQHMPPLFTYTLASHLDSICPLRVCEAFDGQPVVPGYVLIAPGGAQMKVERDGPGVVIRITDEPPEHSCKPSVDYLFRSVAHVYGGNTIGVLMTGMGSDGVQGCRLLKQQGGLLVAQDEASCVVFGMPRELVELGIADVVSPLDQIASKIVQFVGR